MSRHTILLSLLFLFISPTIHGQTSIPVFPVGDSDLTITRLSQPNTYFDKVGRKFAVLGYESGTFEAWAYPLKLFRNVELSFLIGSSTEPIEARDIVRTIAASPEATTLTYVFQSFTVKAIYVTAIDEPGGYVLLDVRSTEPLTIVCSFLPVLQPMWPAGIGGQSAYWRNDIKAYQISEPTRRNTAYIGSPAAEGISYTPAHMLSDKPNQFRIVIDDPAKVRGRYIPIVMAGGRGSRDSIKALYADLAADPASRYTKVRQHYDALRSSTMRIRTPEPNLDLAFEWAKVSFDNLMVDNPDVGLGMVAGLGTSGTGGRPGFGWFFGGDAYINSFSLNSYGAYASTKDALRFTQQWQREDGKMAHELTQAAAYVDWWKDYLYGYIHGDTSPYYICAVWDYFLHTADTAFIRTSWGSIRKAYVWSRATDANGDGLMDNKKAGLGALEYGPLTDIQSDIYTGAVWARATTVMPRLAALTGDAEMQQEAEAYEWKTSGAFDALFWDEKNERYSYAFTADGKHVDIVSPWAAVGLMWDLGTEERSRKTLAELTGAELSTDWGIRSISEKSPYYEPLNYNYGAVWPFLSSWVAAAQFRHDMGLQGYNTLLASVNHTFDNAIGHVTEVFSGSANIWPGEAVAHQGFSSASVVLPLVRGLLGFEPNVPQRSVTFAPRFPADWKSVHVSNPVPAMGPMELSYVRSGETVDLTVVSTPGPEIQFTFAPSFGTGTRIRSVSADGEDVRFTLEERRQSIRPVLTLALKESTTIRIELEPTVEVLPPKLHAKTGDPNMSLKVLDISRTDEGLEVTLEGRAGGSYELGLTNVHLIGGTEGCRLTKDGVRIDFAGQKAEDYVRKHISIRLLHDLR